MRDKLTLIGAWVLEAMRDLPPHLRDLLAEEMWKVQVQPYEHLKGPPGSTKVYVLEMYGTVIDVLLHRDTARVVVGLVEGYRQGCSTPRGKVPAGAERGCSCVRQRAGRVLGRPCTPRCCAWTTTTVPTPSSPRAVLPS